MAALLALLSSLSWGTSDFIGGVLSRRRPVPAVIGGSQTVGLLFLLVFATVSGSWSLSGGYLGWALLASVSGTSGLLLFYRALADGTMGVVAPIASLGVVVLIIAGLAQGEDPSWVQAVAIAVAIAGVVLASGPERQREGGPRTIAFASASALLFGVALLAIARGSETDVVMTMVSMRVCTVSVLLLAALVLRSKGGLTRRDLPLLALAGIGDVGANLLFGFASTKGLLVVVAVLGSLYPVATVLLARWVLNERLRPVQWAGVAAALGGAALLSASGALG